MRSAFQGCMRVHASTIERGGRQEGKTGENGNRETRLVCEANAARRSGILSSWARCCRRRRCSGEKMRSHGTERDQIFLTFCSGSGGIAEGSSCTYPGSAIRMRSPTRRLQHPRFAKEIGVSLHLSSNTTSRATLHGPRTSTGTTSASH